MPAGEEMQFRAGRGGERVMRGRLARQWQSQNSRSRETGGGGRRQEQLGGKRPQRGSGARTGHHGKDTAGSGEPEGDPQTPGRKGSGS